MNKQMLVLLLSWLFSAYVSIGQINIQQISSVETLDFIGLQAANPKQSNVAGIMQLGSDNQASISQQQENTLLKSNKAFLFQEGNQNSANVDQKGSNNVLLSLQLGYLTSLTFDYNASMGSNTLPDLSAFSNFFFGDISISKNNSVTSFQNGQSNSLITLQMGQNNQITATQNGVGNYLWVTQIGQNHIVNDFKQENQSGFLLESVTQLGMNNFIEVTGSVSSQTFGNNYEQTGENLSLQINSGLLSSVGGMQVTQTGHDMTVVIDQSYFSFPMK